MKGPQLLGNLGLVAYGHCVSRRRVEDQCALARDQGLVVRGVVVGIDVALEPLREPLEKFERLPGRVGLDRDRAFSIDKIGAVAAKYCAGHIDCIGTGTESDAEGMSSF